MAFCIRMGQIVYRSEGWPEESGQGSNNNNQPGAYTSLAALTNYQWRCLEGPNRPDWAWDGSGDPNRKEYGRVTCMPPYGLSAEDIWFLNDNWFSWDLIQRTCDDLIAGREIPCAVKDALTRPERDDILWLPEFHDTPLVTQEIWKAALHKRLVGESQPGANDLR
jgi:hypothetical protein